MFAPVGCSECGKLFQVEHAQLGQPASCPWCQARVMALPMAAKAEPLALPEPVIPPGVFPIRKRGARPWLWIAVAFISIFFALGTFLVQRYRNGAVPPFAMRTSTATDGSCQATLPGTAAEVIPPQFTPLQTRASLFASQSWLTRARGGLGWIELDPARAKLVRTEDLLINVRDELGRWLAEPTIEKEGVVKSGSSEGMEVRFGTGTTRFTARILAVLDAPQPRIYLIWVGGPKFDPDGEFASRVLASFRVIGISK